MSLFVTFLYLLFIVTPFSLFVHEMGHVVGARWIHATKITVTIGIGKTIATVSFNTVSFIIRSIYFIHCSTETKRIKHISKREAILVSVLGPLFSLCMSFIFYMWYNLFVPHPSVYLLFLFNLWLGIVNFIPFKIGQKYSDGYVIVKQLMKRS